MMNKSRDGWYAPLAARFQGMEEPMPLARFAAIEAILHLLALNAPATDPAKAYLLFTQYRRCANKLILGKSLSVIYPISAYWHNGVYGYGTHLAAGPAHIGLLSFSKILAG